MRSIIEKLWYGDFHPDEAVPDTEAYLEARRKHHEAYDKLASQLQPEQVKELEELIGYVMDQSNGQVVEAFRQGLRFGIDLMANLSQ